MNIKNKINFGLLIILLLSGCSTSSPTKFDELNKTTQTTVEIKAQTPQSNPVKTKTEQVKPTEKSVPEIKKTRQIKVPKQQVSRYRVGAVCNDGWVSEATGRGACSWHGGVDYWIYNK